MRCCNLGSIRSRFLHIFQTHHRPLPVPGLRVQITRPHGNQCMGQPGLAVVSRCTCTTSAPEALHTGSDNSHDSSHEAFMRAALEEAAKAEAKEEVPVGAVLVAGGRIVARAHNQVEALNDPTAHAEMLCIRAGAASMGSWRLSQATLYVTLEPCPMCAGALLQARLAGLVYGARNPLLGADGSWIAMLPHANANGACEGLQQQRQQPCRPHPFHPDLQVVRGVLEQECACILQRFFRRRREEGHQRDGNVGT